MYSLADYGRMIGDRVRIDAYHRALERAIGPGSVVLDIGAGTGILSLLACRLGARRVIAVEPSSAIRVAVELAEANGYRDRIEVIQGLSTGVTLSEPADVIVSDMRGVLPFHQHHLPAVIDARTRLLAAGGTLIPKQDTLWAAPVEAPETYDGHIKPWADGVYGLDLQRAQSRASNTWMKARVAPAQLLAPPQEWCTVTYETTGHPDARAELRYTAGRAGTLHGFGVWFDADLGFGVRFSNAPGEPEVIYGQALFPLTAPVALDPGDSVGLTLRADLVGDDYVWQWSTRVHEGGSERTKASYRQSTFFGEPLAAASLRRSAATFVPRPGADAAVARVILSLMDGEMSSGDIASSLMEAFPSRFAKWEDALARVARTSLEYSDD